MNPSDEEPDVDEEEPVDRDEWLAQEVDASWTHLTSGDLCSGPTAGWCDVYVRREEDGSYSLRLFGEGLEPSDPPMELDPEGYATAQETVEALAAHGFEIRRTTCRRAKARRKVRTARRDRAAGRMQSQVGDDAAFPAGTNPYPGERIAPLVDRSALRSPGTSPAQRNDHVHRRTGRGGLPRPRVPPLDPHTGYGPGPGCSTARGWPSRRGIGALIGFPSSCARVSRDGARNAEAVLYPGMCGGLAEALRH